jgi:hypothetical protein
MARDLPVAQSPTGDAAVVYAKRSTNIGVPGAARDDDALTDVETAAAARETERGVSNSAQSSNFAPDAADYEARGADRNAAS